MPLSKARNRARMRLVAAQKRLEQGLQPSCNLPEAALSTFPVSERKEILAEIARTPIRQGEVKPGAVISAIQELNKLDGAYPIQRHLHEHVVFEIEIVERTRLRELPASEIQEIAEFKEGEST